MNKAKRYMVPADEKIVNLAKQIAVKFQKQGAPVTYTGIMRQALEYGILEAARKNNIQGY